MKGSNNAPSVASQSPRSHHSSPPPIADSPTQYIPVHGSTWQYHHIQSTDGSNLNVQMEVFPDSFSPVVDMAQGGITGADIHPDNMRLLYEQQHQSHLGPDIQQQLPSHMHQPVSHEISSGMGMGHMPPEPPAQYYGTVFGSSTASLYGQHHLFDGHVPLMHPSNNIQCIPNNPQESWQNFEAQYRS